MLTRRLICLTLVAIVPSVAPGQTGTAIVVGQTMSQETGFPLGYSVVLIPSLSRQQFTNDRGGFTIRDLPAGPLLLRFKHIGNTPRDTTVTLRDGDTLHVDIALHKLVIQLPTMLVNGSCTNEQARAPNVGILGDLFDQVQQNAERYRLLAQSNPFRLAVYRAQGERDDKGKIVASEIDTVVRNAFPPAPYRAGHVMRLAKELGIRNSQQAFLSVPELPDFADTSFTYNHCVMYAGQKMLDGDSVIAVDFEPVPALKNDVDFRGTFFVKAEGYQLVSAVLQMTKIPSQFRSQGMTAVSVSTKFTEILPGVAVLELSELTTTFRRPRRPFVELGQVFNVTWVSGPP